VYRSPDTPEGGVMMFGQPATRRECRKELGRYENVRMAAEYNIYKKLFEPSFFFLGVRAHARQESNLRPKFPEWGPPFPGP